MDDAEILRRFSEIEFRLNTHTHTGVDLTTPFTSAKIVGIEVTPNGSSLSTGDGQAFFRIPHDMEGYILNSAYACVYTAGTTGTTDIQIRNKTTSVDILTTKVTIDSGETDSKTAATPSVVNDVNAGVVHGDLIAVDIDAVSTTPPLGLFVELRFVKK
jgi:hypothetical protein